MQISNSDSLRQGPMENTMDIFNGLGRELFIPQQDAVIKLLYLYRRERRELYGAKSGYDMVLTSGSIGIQCVGLYRGSNIGVKPDIQPFP